MRGHQSTGVNLKSTEAGAWQSKASGTTLPPMALCWESQASRG